MHANNNPPKKIPDRRSGRTAFCSRGRPVEEQIASNERMFTFTAIKRAVTVRLAWFMAHIVALLCLGFMWMHHSPHNVNLSLRFGGF